jgi:hypothetical protein
MRHSAIDQINELLKEVKEKDEKNNHLEKELKKLKEEQEPVGPSEEELYQMLLKLEKKKFLYKKKYLGNFFVINNNDS